MIAVDVAATSFAMTIRVALPAAAILPLIMFGQSIAGERSRPPGPRRESRD